WQGWKWCNLPGPGGTIGRIDRANACWVGCLLLAIACQVPGNFEKREDRINVGMIGVKMNIWSTPYMSRSAFG
ncbi:hypothetical protein EMPG_16565, partial [Blastomyces silverae]